MRKWRVFPKPVTYVNYTPQLLGPFWIMFLLCNYIESLSYKLYLKFKEDTNKSYNIDISHTELIVSPKALTIKLTKFVISLYLNVPFYNQQILTLCGFIEQK